MIIRSKHIYELTKDDYFIIRLKNYEINNNNENVGYK